MWRLYRDALVRVERAGQLRREAVALPVGVAAGERDDVLVAELLERLRGERRARAAGAVDDDRPRAVGRRLLDPRLEVAARDVVGAGDVTVVPLVGLADVDEERRLGTVEKLAGPRSVHLVDLALDLGQQLAIARHDFQEYSGHGIGLRLGVPRRYPRAQMSARARVLTIAGLASVVVVAAIVGATLLQSRSSSSGPASTGAVTKPRPGAPPLILDLGVRDDPEARALAQASALYCEGPADGGRSRSSPATSSLPARIGAAFAAWPDGGLDDAEAARRVAPAQRARGAAPRLRVPTGRAETPTRCRRGVRP